MKGDGRLEETRKERGRGGGRSRKRVSYGTDCFVCDNRWTNKSRGIIHYDTTTYQEQIANAWIILRKGGN